MSAAEFQKSDVVDVNISRATLFPSRAGFGTAIVVDDTVDVIDHGERVRYYTSIAGVAADFVSTRDCYKAASAAFSQSPAPDRFGIATALDADAAGLMKTGAPAAMAILSVVADGEFGISIDGAAQSITVVDFTGDTTHDQAAATLQTKLRAVASGGYTLCTVTHDGVKFTITSGTTGAASSVSALTAGAGGTDIAGAGYLNALAGIAITTDGVTFVSLTEELTAIEDASADWYGFVLARALTPSTVNPLLAAAWAEARKKIYVAQDSGIGALDSASTTDLGYLVDALAYDRTMVFWGNDPAQYPDASFIARMLTVNFNNPNSASTGKFKKLPGISTIQISESQLTVLSDKNVNVYIERGGVPMVEESTMSSGEFFDVMHFVDWLEDAIATDVFALLYANPTKIPYTDAGVALIEGSVRVVLEQGVRSGGIAEDVDEDGDLVAAYTLTSQKVLDTPQTQRATREAPPTTFLARLAGAIHSTTINGTVTV